VLVDETLWCSVCGRTTESAEAVEASDAADALGVNAWLSSGSGPDDDEGRTARMVDFGGSGGGTSSSSASNPFSSKKTDDGGVLPWENLLDEGENDEATRVSVSEMLVDVECLIALLGCKGFGTRVSRRASIDATALATGLESETRGPLLSNEYPGFLRGGNNWEGWLGNGFFE
jgi:hypothetical protein